MGNGNCRLTVYFEEPFWIGVFERICDGKLSAAKVTFGAEPKDYEVQEYILKHYYHLCFSPAVAAAVKEARKNPKRVQRDVKKQLQNVITQILTHTIGLLQAGMCLMPCIKRQ